MSLETIVQLAPGKRLVMSTQRKEGDTFRCSVFEINERQKTPDSFRLVSDGFEAMTCLEAQTAAYRYVQRIYPAYSDQMKNPPYLIWGGPANFP